jgi:hypothetical protein
MMNLFDKNIFNINPWLLRTLISKIKVMQSWCVLLQLKLEDLQYHCLLWKCKIIPSILFFLFVFNISFNLFTIFFTNLSNVSLKDVKFVNKTFMNN